MQTAKFILGILLAFAGCVVSALIPLGVILGIPISLFGTVFIASTNKEPLVKYITIGMPAVILLFQSGIFMFFIRILIYVFRLLWIKI